jgi:hypothetical protein
VDTNQKKKARNVTEFAQKIDSATHRAFIEGLWEEDKCQTIGCMSYNQTNEMFNLFSNQTEWVFIFYVSFVMIEGPENETETDEIVAKMTKLIIENSFDLSLLELNLKFTTLHESNIHSEKDLNWWCKDGDLASYSNGEFSMVDSMGRNWTHNAQLHFLHETNYSIDLRVFIHDNGRIYRAENYVANIMIQSSDLGTNDFNVSGEVTVCENRQDPFLHLLTPPRSTLQDCHGFSMTSLDPGSCEWQEDGSIVYSGGIFSVPMLLIR